MKVRGFPVMKLECFSKIQLEVIPICDLEVEHRTKQIARKGERNKPLAWHLNHTYADINSSSNSFSDYWRQS